MRVLVTGGAGYIGSHAVRALSRAGHQPVVLDNLVYGHAEIVRQTLQVPLVVGQVGDRQLLTDLLRGHHPELAVTGLEGKPIEAVLHFAAYAYVGESVSDPAKYYRNNLGDTLTLLETLIAAPQQGAGASQSPGPIPIVFSSTCATYGVPQLVPMTEEHPQAPINPYGRSKWMVEQLLSDFASAYGLPSVIFRYFNAAGADPAGDLGENHDPETHLIPLVLDVMGGRRPYLQIYGDDYPTPDGTCIRDYIHIDDLAAAHVKALDYLAGGGDTTVLNVGTGVGSSVREVIEATERISGRPVPHEFIDRRAGDPVSTYADPARIAAVLGWSATRTLDDIIASAWNWHSTHLNGYGD